MVKVARVRRLLADWKRPVDRLPALETDAELVPALETNVDVDDVETDVDVDDVETDVAVDDVETDVAVDDVVMGVPVATLPPPHQSPKPHPSPKPAQHPHQSSPLPPQKLHPSSHQKLVAIPTKSGKRKREQMQKATNTRLTIEKFNEMWDNRHQHARDAGLAQFWKDLQVCPGGATSTRNSWMGSLQPGASGYEFKDNTHHMIPLMVLYHYKKIPGDLCDPKIRRQYRQALEKVKTRNTSGVNRGKATDIYDLFVQHVPAPAEIRRLSDLEIQNK